MSKKSLAVAQHILSRCKAGDDAAVTPMQLLKLVYIAHGYMLGLHGRPLLDEEVEAWQYGPVVPSVYRAVKHHRSAPVDMVGPYAFAFSPDELQVMDDVATTYGKYDGILLSAATHKKGTPWHTTWSLNGKNGPISNDMIEGFYRRILSQPSHSSL